MNRDLKNQKLTIHAMALLDDFMEVAKLAKIDMSSLSISVVESPAPHELPPSLKNGDVAVYVFIWKGECLKVGKVGPKSHARYISHHYNPSSSPSNLARSILIDKDKMGLQQMSEQNIGKWISENVDRVNYVIHGTKTIPTLNLLEVFLQCRLTPRFEGFKSQR